MPYLSWIRIQKAIERIRNREHGPISRCFKSAGGVGVILYRYRNRKISLGDLSLSGAAVFFNRERSNIFIDVSNTFFTWLEIWTIYISLLKIVFNSPLNMVYFYSARHFIFRSGSRLFIQQTELLLLLQKFCDRRKKCCRKVRRAAIWGTHDIPHTAAALLLNKEGFSWW